MFTGFVNAVEIQLFSIGYKIVKGYFGDIAK